MVEANRIEVSFKPPRLVSVVIHGNYDVPQANETFDRIDALVGQNDYFLLEVVMDHIAKTSAEARRVAAQRLQGLPRRVIAITGGSFAQRIAAKLVLTAALALDSKNTKGNRTPFRSSDEAQAWLIEAGERWAKSG